MKRLLCALLFTQLGMQDREEITEVMVVVGFLWIDTDGDKVPDHLDTDDDNDGLSDAQEAALKTNPLKKDTDGDGYSDYAEVADSRLKSPPAQYRTSGVSGANPLVFDVFLEIDYMAPKTWWFISYCGHKPSGEYLEDMIDRFADQGKHMFILVDDAVPHDDDASQSEVFSILGSYQDYPVYYYCLFADESDGLPKHGYSWMDKNVLVVFEGVWYLVGDLVGMTLMHELGHLLIDNAWVNPKAYHLLSMPWIWADGIHCPFDCVLNYASNLSVWDAIGQWWEFDFCAYCWAAVRGFTSKP